MSKASEWARRVKEADIALDQVKGDRPERFALRLNTKDALFLSVDDRGTPRLTTPEARNGYELDEGPLIDMARWILDVFGEAQGHE